MSFKLTFANMLPVVGANKKVVVVPVYKGADGDRSSGAGGSIHCSSKTLAAH